MIFGRNDKKILEGNLIYARWEETSNFGDILNPVIIKCLSGFNPVNIGTSKAPKNAEVYVIIGSTLSWWKDRNMVLWGAGFMFSHEKLRVKPKRICAVRGPLSREIIVKQKIDCPEIYGDPVLLYPLFYKPTMEKKYRLGIIPHHSERRNPAINALLQKFKDDQDVSIIDITSGVNEFVNAVCSCGLIASSALHGIICADAYGIPSTWIALSDKVYGKEFKFMDYFLSVGRKEKAPLQFGDKTTLQQIYDRFYDYKIDIDLNKLLEACPFKKKDLSVFMS